MAVLQEWRRRRGAGAGAGSVGGRRIQSMRQQLGGVALHFLQLIELKVGVGDGENVARPGVFVNETRPLSPWICSLTFRIRFRSSITARM
jgi:hypothetical protein